MARKKIKNPNYRNFLDNGLINIITAEQFQKALNNANGPYGQYRKQARALLILLYYSGARPNEVLRVKSKDVTREKNDVKVFIKGSKRGLPRTLFFSYSNKHIKELFKYATSTFPDVLLFYKFVNKYDRTVNKKDGSTITRKEISNSLRYYISKWFENVIDGNITTYFLRHNRFSSLAEKGATARDIKFVKGSRSMESVEPYLHLSTAQAKKLKRLFN